MVKERTNNHRNMKIMEFELSHAAIQATQELEEIQDINEVQGLEG